MRRVILAPVRRGPIYVLQGRPIRDSSLPPIAIERRACVDRYIGLLLLDFIPTLASTVERQPRWSEMRQPTYLPVARSKLVTAIEYRHELAKWRKTAIVQAAD